MRSKVRASELVAVATFFWISAAGVIYPYLGYPLLLWVLGRLLHRQPRRTGQGEDPAGHLVQLGEPHPGQRGRPHRREHLGDHHPRGPHGVQLTGGAQLDHLVVPPVLVSRY